jgi:hypothetical protein
MQFEVNGQMYFLNFDPRQGRWFVYEPTRDGMLAVRVHDDGAPLLMPQELDLDFLDSDDAN